MAEPQITPQEDDISNAAETSPLEHAGSSEEERLAAHVASLRHHIEEANYEYYVQDNPTLTDAEYDQLMLELHRIEQEHPELQTPDSPTQRVAAGPVEEVLQLPHPAPIRSLSTARSKQQSLACR